MDEVLKYFDLAGAKSVVERSNWAEDVVRFLNNPIISSILIMIGFFGLFAEIKSPGWGVPGTAGVLALTLFFGSSYILQLASIVEILMFIAGLGLILLEVFVIPGFGIAGIGGILLIIASLFLALVGADPFLDMRAVSMAIIQLTVALVLSIILIIVLAKFLPRTNIFKKFVLSFEEKSEEGFVSHSTSEELVGKTGKALTDLRPSGTAEIDDKRVDVVTDSEFIEKGSNIEVLEVEGIRVVVKKIQG
jgi:membrane-bound serine protease (ClpP class)